MAGKLSKNLTRIVTLVVVVAIVAVGAYFVFGDSGNKKVTAEFTAAVGIYNGTPVRQLGVNVGKVTNVKPEGNKVRVEIEYESQYSLPRNATAVEVANSLVSDRYIQLSAYTGSGPKMGDGATIPLNRTAAPAELDDIYKALNTLSTALGPNGANSNGALSNLLKVGAANLSGNGAALGQSIENLSKAAKTLADGREDLFGTVSNLRRFTGALKDSDGEVRKFNTLLAAVANNLASERSDLGGALKQLGLALQDVNQFVRKNASRVRTSVTGLKNLTNVLVKQKASLDETLAIAPVALANIVHAYQPNLGVIATRSNLAALFDPGQLCTIIDVTAKKASAAAGAVLDQILPGVLGNLLGPLTDTIVSTCQSVVKQSPDLSQLAGTAAILKLAGSLLGALGGLPSGPITGGGS